MLVPAYKHSVLGEDIARWDRNNNRIVKNGKGHKVTFTDQVERQPLVKVHFVESYKRYNQEDPVGSETPCCLLF